MKYTHYCHQIYEVDIQSENYSDILLSKAVLVACCSASRCWVFRLPFSETSENTVRGPVLVEIKRLDVSSAVPGLEKPPFLRRVTLILEQQQHNTWIKLKGKQCKEINSLISYRLLLLHFEKEEEEDPDVF